MLIRLISWVHIGRVNIVIASRPDKHHIYSYISTMINHEQTIFPNRPYRPMKGLIMVLEGHSRMGRGGQKSNDDSSD